MQMFQFALSHTQHQHNTNNNKATNYNGDTALAKSVIYTLGPLTAVSSDYFVLNATSNSITKFGQGSDSTRAVVYLQENTCDCSLNIQNALRETDVVCKGGAEYALEQFESKNNIICTPDDQCNNVPLVYAYVNQGQQDSGDSGICELYDRIDITYPATLAPTPAPAGTEEAEEDDAPVVEISAGAGAAVALGAAAYLTRDNT